jgi:hypothetical protein
MTMAYGLGRWLWLMAIFTEVKVLTEKRNFNQWKSKQL